MKTTLCRSGCCTVKWCPLVPCWATTIHKFQGFEAGFDPSDMFRYLIVDPGDLKWEQDCPGALYVALSRAKTMGDFTGGTESFTKKSAIYWKGDGITTKQIMEGSMKNGPKKGAPKVKCDLIQKRDLWVHYLNKRRDATTSISHNNNDLSKIENLRLSQNELHERIAQTVTTPNPTWLALKRKSYSTPKTYFGTYA